MDFDRVDDFENVEMTYVSFLSRGYISKNKHIFDTLATHKIALLIGSQVLLGNNAPYGTVLHKHHRVAQAAVLDLQRHTYEEGPMFRPLHQLLQGRLGTFLHIGIGHRPIQRCTAQRAGRKNSQQRLLAFGSLQLFQNPFQIFFRIIRHNVVLYYMYIHNQRVFAINDVN